MEIVGWVELNEMTLFNRGNCGPKDSPPPTGGLGPVGAQGVAPPYLLKGVVTTGERGRMCVYGDSLGTHWGLAKPGEGPARLKSGIWQVHPLCPEVATMVFQ